MAETDSHHAYVRGWFIVDGDWFWLARESPKPGGHSLCERPGDQTPLTRLDPQG
jgi:hypothetical protein